MSASAIPPSLPSSIAQGERFHHLCDKEFHRLREFRNLESQCFAHLTAEGIRRGPARAMAHLGVELSMDGFLVQDQEYAAHYRAALEAGLSSLHQTPDKIDELAAIQSGPPTSLTTLLPRLVDIGPPLAYSQVEELVLRMRRILSKRPLLAFSSDEEEPLCQAYAPIHDKVMDATTQIMAALKRSL